MELAVKIGQLLLSLSILIILHEMGHFFPARWFKTRVEKFYLFFDPYFHIFEKQIGETKYGIGWLPLGGYVKIAGMVDESMDTEALQQPPQPWEFRSKPAWQRLIIMLGGVIVNFILGIVIIAGMLMYYGEENVPMPSAKDGIYADSLGRVIGLASGDKILSVGDKKAAQLSAIDGGLSVIRAIVLGSAKTIEVERNGQPTTITLPSDVSQILTKSENQEYPLFIPRIPFEVSKITSTSHNTNSGLKAKDRLVEMNGVDVSFYDQFKEFAKQNTGKTVQAKIVRNGKDTAIVSLNINNEARIGIETNLNFADYLTVEKKKYGFGEAIVAASKRAVNFIGTQITAFGKIFKGEIKARDSFGGFDVIANKFGGEWIWERFWQMTASLSLILAFMNLLPIPGLDGGHVVFTLYEMITGRKPNDKFLEYATMVGIILVLGLMLYANIFRHWF